MSRPKVLISLPNCGRDYRTRVETDVTENGPEVALAGTITMMLRSVQIASEAGTAFSDTVLEPCDPPKPDLGTALAVRFRAEAIFWGRMDGFGSAC
jgi:hypothetical protein